MHPYTFVESYFDAWNHHDPVAIADHLAANGTYCDVPENRQRSHDELILSLTRFFARQQHVYEPVGEVIGGENTIAFQYRMTPVGCDQDSGTFGPVQGAEFITLSGDTAMTIMDYYEVPGVSRHETAARHSQSTPNGRKYAKSGLSDEQMSIYKQRLSQIMQTETAYLRSDLTLPRLAEAIDCSVNHLSQVINGGFGVSFFDYLNAYRIEHAKRLLTEADGRGGAVLNVAFTVGFNSNSAFYSAFKKYVGETPAQYRKQQLSS